MLGDQDDLGTDDDLDDDTDVTGDETKDEGTAADAMDDDDEDL